MGVLPLQFEDGRVIDAKIPRGVRNGSRVRLSGLGGPGSGGGEAGPEPIRFAEDRPLRKQVSLRHPIPAVGDHL